MTDPAPAAETVGPARSVRPWAPLLVVAALMLAAFGWSLAGERIPVNEGCGFDGAAVYAPLAADFLGHVRHITRERLQRTLPSLTVHLALRALGVDERGFAVIAEAFTVLNLALLGLGLLLWHRVGDALDLSPRARWLAAGALFVSFAALKMPFYYPVLTDTAGLVLSIAALLAWLEGSTAALALVLGLAAFTWPTLTWSGALLLAIPRRAEAPARGWTPATVGLGLVPALLIGVFAARNAYLVAPVASTVGEHPLYRPTLPLSIAAVVAWLAAAGVGLLAAPACVRPRALWARLSLTGLGFAVAGLVAWQVVVAASGLPAGRSPLEFMLLSPDSAATRSVRLPLLFVVAHATYYGPVVLLAVAHFRALCAEAWSHGVGVTAFLLLGVVSAVTTESRHVLHVIPFVVALTASALDRRGRVGALELAVVLGGGLVASKAWLPMSAPGLGLERYLAQVGPWMPVGVYLAHGAACVAVLVALLASRRRG